MIFGGARVTRNRRETNALVTMAVTGAGGGSDPVRAAPSTVHRVRSENFSCVNEYEAT